MREPGEDDKTLDEIRRERDEREGGQRQADYLDNLSLEELRAQVVEYKSNLEFLSHNGNGADHNFKRELADDLSLAEAKFRLREEALKQAEKLPQGKFWPELISAKDLLSLPPDATRWIWENTLPTGGCSVLVAKPKVGKTTLAVGLALAVARGGEFLGRSTIQAPVAYLSLDASLPEIAENFTTAGLRAGDPVFIHAGGVPEKVLDWLLECIKTHSIRLVIIDTLQRFCRFKDANDYSQVINMMEPLLDAAREAKIHLLFTHHAKKDSSDDLDSAIGSTAIRGMAYTYLHLKRLPDSERRILRSDQRGGKNIPEIALGFDKFNQVENQGTRQEAEIKEAEPKILELFEESSELTEKEIRRALPLRGWITGAALRQLHKTGEIERQGEGKSGHPYRYTRSQSLVPTLPVPLFGYTPNSSLLLREEQKRDILPGLDTDKTRKSQSGVRESLVPEFWDETGTRRDETFSDHRKRRGIIATDILREFPGTEIRELTASIGEA